MKIRLRAIILPICFILLFGCSTDPNEKANELFVKASSFMKSAKAQTESYSKALELYKSAQKEIDLILSKYSSSNVAVNLMSEQTKISGFTLSRFQKLESSLRSLAEAEQRPFSCALLLAVNIIKDEYYKVRALATIAEKYAEAGQQPDEKGMAILRDIVHIMNPMNLFWK